MLGFPRHRKYDANIVFAHTLGFAPNLQESLIMLGLDFGLLSLAEIRCLVY